MHAEGRAAWAELWGEASAAQLVALAAGSSGGAELLLPPADKGGRRAQHALLRSHFPCIAPCRRSVGDAAPLPPGALPQVCVRAQPALKAIALDLDGTLWPGVLLEGPAAASDWAAGSFAALAAQLLRLQAAGVLLFSCSRNDEAPVLAAWPSEELCALQPRHFVAHAFGWDAKSARLARLAHAVGFAHEALLFIDDTAAEREEVRVALPRCRVAGGDMALAAALLTWEAERCVAAGVTDDAASRTEKTRALLARAAAAAEFEPADAPAEAAPAAEPAAGRGDRTRRRAARAVGARLRVPGTGGGYATVGGFPLPFLRTLSLSLTLRRHGASEVGAAPPALQNSARASSGLARAAELAARSTQFNTAVALPFAKWGAPQAGRLAQFESLVADGRGEVWTMTAADRFGEHGMVGVAALQGGPAAQERRVLLVAVSCRVLALECAPVFAAEVLRRSGCLAGPEPVRASLAITERNGPCRSLFSRLGFVREGETSAGAGDAAAEGLQQQEWVLQGGTVALPETDASIYCVSEED
jgi:HAD superfamily phosphatase (TIGR01681 family)